MKNRYITAAVCLALCLLAEGGLLHAQTGSMNYIKTIELMAGVTTAEGVNGLPEDLKRTTISYFDGLGRPIQEVTVAKSPGRKDLVQHIEYDAFGRNPRQYLPFTAATQGGGYHANAMNSLQQFYSGSIPGVPLTGVYYAQTDFEPSPLNRVMRTASPGEAWAMDMGHAVGYGYEAIQPYEVMRFTVNGDVVSCSAPTHYDANSLYKNSVTDEDGQTSITYTDLEGRVVLKRAVLGSNNFADTYFVYNDLGLLVCVMMPEAVKNTGTFSDFKNAFLYKYDARKRMVRKKIPGADSICYVYNKADLLVAEQDGNMRKKQNWKFYKYDGLQRVILEGLLNSNASTRVQLQQAADTYSTTLFEAKQTGYFDYFLGYSNNAFPYITGGGVIKQAFYYDDYFFDGNELHSIYNVYFQSDVDFSDAATLMTKGRLTGKIDKSTNTTEVFYYDEYGRMVQSAISYFSGVFYEGNKFSFSGQLLQSNKRFKTPNNGFYEYSFSYFYDHDWRPTYTEMEVGGTVQRLNTMQYNELAQLETKYLHGDATDYLQQQSYAYNIRGWLTGINSLQQGSTGVFAQKLYYNTVPPGTTGQATARFNGNISASEWRVNGITPTDFSSGYAYSYDPLNRLTKAAYYKRNIGSSVIGWEGAPASNKSSWGEITGIGSEKDITYDKNGNIKTLSRQARRNSDTDIVLFDNLSYTYNGNVLLRVSDAVIGQNTLGDFPGTAEQASETFFYDKNGNMTSDAVRGLRLSYDHNNMPLVIQNSDGTITNTYAWDGTKRRRVVKEGAQTLSDECYYGDLVVENGQPLRILHAEGYVDVSGMPVFNYHLKDHLGNVRAVISSSYGPGAYTQTQASDYYPFGMAHTVEISSVKNGKAMEAVRVDPRETDESKTFTRSNAYLYNGKEEQPMPGKWLDYGARFYDAQLGRWHSVDPAAALYYPFSPYQYGGNSPVNTIDIGGKLFVYVNGFMLDHWWAGIQPTKTLASQGTIQNPLYSEYAPDRNFYSDGPRNAGKLFEKDYWHGIPSQLSKYFDDKNMLFTNGSFTPGSSGSERFGEGYKNASKLIKKLENGDIKLSEGETIKIMGHSQGAAYAAGLATALLEHPVYKHLVEFVVYLAPDQPNQFKHPEGVPGYQFSTQSDWVSSTGPLAWLRNSEYQKIDGAIWAQQRYSYFDSRGGHGVDTWIYRIIVWALSYGIPVTVEE